jgi:hypothetical protein
MRARVAGNYLLIDSLRPGDTIRLEFPIGEVVEKYTIGTTVYTAVIRGSTVVDIHPRATAQLGQQNAYPFFVREHLRNSSAPTKTVRRFLAATLPATS